VVFPFIVLSGVGRSDWARTCRLSGELSYPLYMVHFPVLWLIAAFTPKGVFSVAAAALLVTLAVSAAAWKLYDVPVRRWLGQLHYGRERVPALR
jgi:peptidoglycan/LPS O-acetylase OafA/YrhL